MIQDKKIIANYANVLFKNAKSHHEMQEYLKQISFFWQVISSMDNLVVILSSPVIPYTGKCNVIKLLSNKLNCMIVIQQFFCVLAKNFRINLIPEIIEEYQNILYVNQGIKRVNILSSNRLQESEIDIVRKFLSQQISEVLEIENIEDKSLLGGIKIQYDSIVRDYSLQGALDKISKIAKNTSLE